MNEAVAWGCWSRGGAHPSRVADDSSMFVPVSALLTGQFFLASSAAAANSASEIPGTDARTESCIPVIPSGSAKVTFADVVMAVGGCPPWVSPNARAMEKQAECAAAMSSSGLVRPLGASARDAQVSSKLPTPEESRLTEPLPASSGPSQRVVAVRTVATAFPFPFSHFSVGEHVHVLRGARPRRSSKAVGNGGCSRPSQTQHVPTS